MTAMGRQLLLLAPMAFVIGAFSLAFAGLFWSSLTHGGLALYAELLADETIQRVLFRTAWIAVVTTAICALLAYPLALFLARSPRRNLWLILVISPWLVSIVVRTFGWVVLLGNRGVINNVLHDLGLLDTPIRVLFSPTAVIVGLVHVFLPYMVIAILSSLLQQDRRLEEAGQILGGTRWQVFRRITLPLSMSGVIGGASLVLLMSTGAIVTPLLLGGLRDRMIGTQIYSEVFQVFNFERATALAVILLVVSLLLVTPLRIAEARLRLRQGAR